VTRRLTAIEQERDAFTKLDLEEQVKKYVVELQAEMAELINANPQNPEERHQVFLLKKQIVDSVLAEARIDWFISSVWLCLLVSNREPACNEPGDEGENKRKYAHQKTECVFWLWTWVLTANVTKKPS
jgi:hypothetical protein